MEDYGGGVGGGSWVGILREEGLGFGAEGQVCDDDGATFGEHEFCEFESDAWL